MENCVDLRILRLGGNKIDHIDLRPLASCTELRRLGLAMNAIEEIDLTPLKNLKKVTAFDIAGNRLSAINLQPLSKWKSLAELYLYSDHKDERNDFKEIDISPLFKCEELEDIGIGEDTNIQAQTALSDNEDIPLAIEELIDDDRVTWI